MTEFDVSQATHAYPEGIEEGFWTLARSWIIDRAIRHTIDAGLRSSSGRILEIGCGPGVVVESMRRAGHAIWGVELGSPAVRKGAAPFVTTGTLAQDLNPSFRANVETLMFLDVIEHIEDEVSFLQEILPAFPQCRCIIVTVPARQEAWSNYDVYYGHFRRYTKSTLNSALIGAGAIQPRTRYFFRSLYIAARLINLTGQKRSVVLEPPKLKILHRAAAEFLRVEDRLFGHLPIPGLSLLSVASVSPKAFVG